jgi:translation elongation factor EF-1alpha
MATKFVFPKAPKVGDRIEIVSISETKLPINIVGNSEAGKNLKLIFPDETKSDVADGETIIATINENNTVYTFKCVTAQDIHTWLLEGTCLYSEIVALKVRVEALETALDEMIGDVE